MNKSSKKTEINPQSLKDPYDRRIDYIRISVTDRCNLKCVYCTPGRGLKNFKESEILTTEEILRLVRIAHKHGLRKVRITGGEPLMRKNVVQLISNIKKIGVHDLSLTTNGIMLSRLAGDLKGAGLDRVNISLDTMVPSKYKAITKGGNIKDVFKAIEEAEKAGLLPIKINFVPIRGLNDGEIVDFALLTFEKDYHIRFIEFMPVKCSDVWKQERYVKSSEVLDKISSLGKLECLEFKGKGPSRNYRINGAKGIIGIISPLTDHFCGFCNKLRLTADGRIKPCLFSTDEVDIKTPMRQGASDKEIEKLFLHSIKIKPEGHSLNKIFKTISPMSKIGG